MSAKVANELPYIISSRSFPTKDVKDLSDEVDRMYVDVANKINDRSIGIYATSPTITGEAWYYSAGKQKQQSVRKIISITGAGSYAHNIDISQISGLTKLTGVFTDGSSNWYPLPYVDVTAVGNQVSLSLTSANVVVTAGGGSPPTISSGTVIIEWTTLSSTSY